MQDAWRVAPEQRPGRIDDPVADRPDDGEIEGVEPPLRQRRIQLLDAVPLMSGRRCAGDAVNIAVIGHVLNPPATACVSPRRKLPCCKARVRTSRLQGKSR